MNIIKRIKAEILDIFFKFWFILLPLMGLLLVGIFGQFSVGGPLFIKHIIKVFIAVSLMIVVALSPRKFWLSYANIFYIVILLLLISVEIFGATRLGAKRWLSIYEYSLQPSELMKLAIILVLARYYALFSENELFDIRKHLAPIMAIIIPVFFILKQPDLGTAILLSLIGCFMLYSAGLRIKYAVYSLLGAAACAPVIWQHLKVYQKNRILTFLNPDRDPLGTGYHILQSKIAIGSGGFWGRGYLNGTQTSLDFLPEKNTDFIFTAISEENGFIGACIIIMLFLALIIGLLVSSTTCKNQFGQYVCVGVAALIFAHAFINISMVIGLMPVVGVPIPFISYGGSSMITCLSAIGTAISCTKGKMK